MFEQSVELPMIDTDKSLSVQITRFKTMIWFVPVMFIRLPTCVVLHLYGCHRGLFSFFRFINVENSACIKMYKKKTPHSRFYLNWLQ